MRIKRILIGFTAFAAVCAIVLVTVLYLYFTENRLKALVVPSLERAIARQVEIDAIRLTVLTGLGASIDGLRISDREGFGDGLFLAADHASIDISLWSLATGSDSLGDLHVVRPTVYIIVDRRGVANYRDLFASGGTGRGRATPVLIPVSNIHLTEGSITYADHRNASVSALTRVDYDLTLAAEEGRVSARGDLQIGGFAGLLFTLAEGIRIHHDLTLNPGEARLEINRLAIEAGPFQIEIQGSVSDLDKTSDVDLTVRNERNAFEGSIEGQSALGELSLEATIRGPIDIESDPPKYPALTGSLDIRDLHIETPLLTAPIEEGTVAWRLVEGDAIIDTIGFRAADSDFGLTGRVTGLAGYLFDIGRPHFQFELRSTRLDLDALIPAQPVATARTSSHKIGWVASAYAELEITQDPPVASAIPDLVKAIDASGDLRVGQLTSGGTLNNVRARLTARDGLVDVTELRGEAYGGVIEGRLHIDATGNETYPTSGAFKVEATQAEGFFNQLLDLPIPLEGLIDAEIDFEAELDSTLALIEDRVDATIDGGGANGQIANWEWFKKSAGTVSQLSFFNFDRIPIKNLRSRLTVGEGRVRLDDVRMTAADVPTRLYGSVGLDGGLACKLDFDLPVERLNVGGFNVGKALGSLFGRQLETIHLTLSFGGTIENPSVAVSTR